MQSGKRAFGDDELLAGVLQLPRRGLAHLHRRLEIALLAAPGAAMARAALDHVRHPLQGSASASRPPSAQCSAPAHGRRHARRRRRRAASCLRPAPLLRAMSTTYSREVECRLGQALDALVVRQDQRPFEFQHQRAGRHQRDNVVALVDPGRESRGDLARRLRDISDASPCSSCGMPQQAG